MTMITMINRIHSKRKSHNPTIRFETDKEGTLRAAHDIFKCKLCKYLWKPRTKKPKECPNCKSRKWRKDDREIIKLRTDTRT